MDSQLGPGNPKQLDSFLSISEFVWLELKLRGFGCRIKGRSEGGTPG
jgi:hypothetical protein